MRRRAAGLISITLAITVVFFFVFKHYRVAVLTPAELTLKQPKPPERPEDCGEIRRAMALPIAPGHEKPGHEKGPTETVEPEQAETGLFYDRRPGIRWVAGLPAVCGQACQNPNNPSDIFDGFQHWPSFLIGPPSCRSAKAGAAEIKAAIATVAAAIVN